MTNIRSLIGKIDELSATVLTTNPDVVCITESWLDNKVDSTSVSLPGYFTFRKDRSDRRGGGVVIFARHSICCHNISPSSFSRDDVELIIIDLESFNLYVICLYIPPAISHLSLREIHDELVHEIDALLAQSPQRRFIVLGDFNHFNSDDLCGDLDMVDIIKNPTRGPNILDHILVSQNLSEAYRSENVIYNAPIGNSDHLTLYAVPIVLTRNSTKTREVSIFDLRKSNLNALRNRLSQISWESILHCSMEVNEMCVAFHDSFRACIMSCIPCRRIIMTSRDKEWLSPLTKSLIEERWDAYRRCDWARYKILKEKVKIEIVKSKRIYTEKMKKSTNGIWKLVKNVSGRNNARSWDSLTSKQNPKIIAINVANALKTKYNNDTDDETQQISLEDNEWSLCIDENTVYRYLKSLSASKAMGIDCIPTKIYSELADCLAKPLTFIFNASVKQRNYPSQWKTAIICPIPKTFPPTIDKIRPVSILPAVSKVFEKIILASMWCKFEKHYGQSQHGFRSKHSSTTAIIHLMEAAISNYDDASNDGVAIITFDMSAAFDSIDHSTAIKKFCALEFPKGFTKWLASYLSDRKFLARVESHYSQVESMSKGVPQGSVLGPSIFSIFTSDLQTVKSSTTLVKYADDINLVIPLKKNCNPESDILMEIQNVEKWCQLNKLSLNKDKSNILVCARNNSSLNFDLPIATTDKATILGVTINNKLNWTDHISKSLLKCNQRFYILRKLRNYVDPDELKLIYGALIRSLVEYASPCFVGLPNNLEKKLEKIERRAHKIINVDRNTDVSFEVKQRREAASKKLFLTIAKSESHILYKYIPIRLQHSQQFNIKYTRTTKYQRSFFPCTALLLNSCSFTDA